MDDNNFINLSAFVPDFISEIEEIKSVYAVEGEELGLLEKEIKDTLNQFRVDTATWGLDIWEKIYGIETDLSLTYEERREIVKAKIRGQGTTTIAMIKNTAEAFSGGEVEIIERNTNSYFVVKFVGTKGVPSNMTAFCNMLNEIKPAHLNYEFEYTYNIVEVVKPFTVAEVKKYTVEELLIYKLEH